MIGGRPCAGVWSASRRIVDDLTKEAIDIVVDHGISGQYVARVLDAIARFRPLPLTLRTDQGPEFTGLALDQ